MNNKAQIDFPLIAFVILIVGIIIASPIILKVFISVKTPFDSAMSNVTGGDIAASNFDHVINTGINFWDQISIAVFVFAVILMFVSAFFIDVHPFWIILYIIIAIFLLIFTPSVMQAADSIYESSNFVTETLYLNFLNSIRTHFGEILVGLYVITGIIIFGKVVVVRGMKK